MTTEQLHGEKVILLEPTSGKDPVLHIRETDVYPVSVSRVDLWIQSEQAPQHFIRTAGCCCDYRFMFPRFYKASQGSRAVWNEIPVSSVPSRVFFYTINAVRNKLPDGAVDFLLSRRTNPVLRSLPEVVHTWMRDKVQCHAEQPYVVAQVDSSLYDLALLLLLDGELVCSLGVSFVDGGWDIVKGAVEWEVIYLSSDGVSQLDVHTTQGSNVVEHSEHLWNLYFQPVIEKDREVGFNVAGRGVDHA